MVKKKIKGQTKKMSDKRNSGEKKSKLNFRNENADLIRDWDLINILKLNILQLLENFQDII